MNEDIKSNIDSIRAEIEEELVKCGRKGDDVKLIAVSKTFPSSVIKEAYDAGQRAFGESYPQELRDKLPEFQELGIEPELHFIGNLQRNKAKYVVGNSSLIHSVSSIKLAKEIDKLASRDGIKQDILLQFNISGEKAKGGFEPEELMSALNDLATMDTVVIKGVMGMSGLDSSDSERQAEFARLKSISDKLVIAMPEAKEISMGMSGDYKLAIREGSTMVRIGSAIFGERTYRK